MHRNLCNSHGCTHQERHTVRSVFGIKEVHTCTTPFPQLHYVTGGREEQQPPAVRGKNSVNEIWHGMAGLLLLIRFAL